MRETYGFWKVQITIDKMAIKKPLFKGFESDIDEAREEAKKWIGDKKNSNARLLFGDRDMGSLG
ncbi:MAG TPA: hypothetical protein P5096_01515 [Patescibacteria group bacterium]|nr:hypothetical protein [Patescibacteria group bacterium]